ncbi:unnamed protein product [Clavelina lepadiformis]|uniref:Uncharacterized protein n=1 Tax=Clavelina lepadiformis TaxID=159417 RepID=A0ABP0G8X5_CLALP
MESDSSSSSEEECLAIIAVALTYRQRKHRVYDAKTVEFFDPATNKWQVSTNMDRQRWCPCVLSI